MTTITEIQKALLDKDISINKALFTMDGHEAFIAHFKNRDHYQAFSKPDLIKAFDLGLINGSGPKRIVPKPKLKKSLPTKVILTGKAK